MNAKLLLLSVVTGALLVGCGGMTRGGAGEELRAAAKAKQPSQCKKSSSNCESTITASNCPGANCSVDYDVAIVVQDFEHHKPTIKFKISGAQINDIQFVDSSSHVTCSAQGDHWECDISQSQEGVWKYKLVLDVGTIDPWLVND